MTRHTPTQPTCDAATLLALLPPDSTTEQLLNAARAHLILCPIHSTSPTHNPTESHRVPTESPNRGTQSM